MSEDKVVKLKCNMVFSSGVTMPAGIYKGPEVTAELLKELESGSPHTVDMTPEVKQPEVKPKTQRKPRQTK